MDQHVDDPMLDYQEPSELSGEDLSEVREKRDPAQDLGDPSYEANQGTADLPQTDENNEADRTYDAQNSIPDRPMDIAAIEDAPVRNP